MKALVMDNYNWWRNIFVMINNPNLQSKLLSWAMENGNVILEADSCTDLIVGGFFIGIVDRTAVDKKDWESYIDYIKMISDGIFTSARSKFTDKELRHLKSCDPLIVVDSGPKEVFKYPEFTRIYYISQDEPDKMIQLIKAEFKKNSVPKMVNEVRNPKGEKYFGLREIGLFSLITEKVLTNSVKSVWRKGDGIKLIHESCPNPDPKPRGQGFELNRSMSCVIDMYGTLQTLRMPDYNVPLKFLQISKDQVTTSVTDMVECHCPPCGKTFSLNAGYVEALALFNGEYLERCDEIPPE